jgi:hypothetical protein
VLLRGLFSHQDIAELVAASRPRVTEHLAQLEREHLIIRQAGNSSCASTRSEALSVLLPVTITTHPSRAVRVYQMVCALQNISNDPGNTFISSKRLLSLTWVSPTIEPVPRHLPRRLLDDLLIGHAGIIGRFTEVLCRP